MALGCNTEEVQQAGQALFVVEDAVVLLGMEDLNIS